MIKKVSKWTAKHTWILVVAFLVLLNITLFAMNIEIDYEGIMSFFSGFTPEGVISFVKGYGMLAPVLIVIIFIFESILAPIPGNVVTIATGSLYGPVWGTVLATVGITIGAIFPFYISRIFGRPVVEKLVNKKHLEKADRFFNEHKGIFIFALIRILPIATFDVISYSAGLTKMSFPKYLLVTAITTAPKVLLYTNLGHMMFNGSKIALAVLVILTVIGIITFFAGIWAVNRVISKRREKNADFGED